MAYKAGKRDWGSWGEVNQGTDGRSGGSGGHSGGSGGHSGGSGGRSGG
ncbi:hypothetical protein PCCS19_41430 [Paenibacillus sp. CCS19]|nr:hypothetical protein [Paenibacillus cellulosilyticus]GMK41087.1 hypothetical protein PCCS19_41430 [Paenibacillus cellulosilyticus]